MFAADLALLGITLLWAVSFSVTKELLVGLPTPTLLALRFALAAAALLALRPRTLRDASPAAWGAGLLLGAILYGGFVLQTLGLADTTPARSAFLTASYVFIVPLLGFACFRERPGRGVAGGALLATAGLVLLTRPEVSAEVRRGDVLSALWAVGFALHILGLGRVAVRVPATSLALTQVLGAAALALGAALLQEPSSLAPAALARIGPAAWGGVAFLGLGCTALAYFVQTWAQARTGPARVALIFASPSSRPSPRPSPSLSVTSGPAFPSSSGAASSRPGLVWRSGSGSPLGTRVSSWIHGGCARRPVRH